MRKKENKLLKHTGQTTYFFNKAEKLEYNKIQTHKKTKRFLGIDNINLGNEIEAAVQTYRPELLTNRKNFVQHINREQVEYLKRKLNTDIHQLVDATKIKARERTP